MSFLKDILREEKDGKYSSKKIWGHIFLALVGASFVLDGMHFYKANVDLFNPLLVAGCTLLGLTILKGFAKK